VRAQYRRLVTPNDAHRAKARLEASGPSRMLPTQNVLRLHQAAGSKMGEGIMPQMTFNVRSVEDLEVCVGKLMKQRSTASMDDVKPTPIERE
jgi:NAD-dependent SIR2 family protein deacetylase